MKSYKNIKKEAAPKKTQKENAPDIISKSLEKIETQTVRRVRMALLIFKYFSMSTLKNHVQLIGNVGQEPTITNLESGKK